MHSLYRALILHSGNSNWISNNRLLRGGQPIVDCDAADIRCFYVTTGKALNFQGDIPSFLIDKFKNHYVRCLNWLEYQMQLKVIFTQNCSKNRLKRSFFLVQNTFLNFLYWESECQCLQLTSLVLLGRLLKLDDVLFSNQWIEALHSGIRTLVVSFQDKFLLFVFVFLPIWKRNPAIHRMTSTYWFQSFVGTCFLQTISDVTGRTFSYNITSRWYQSCYSIILPSPRMLFLHDKCSFPSLQLRTRRKYWSSRW